MSLGRYAADTDAGRKRLRNEDAHVCDPPLFAVADGMGGAAAGELASGLAAAALREQGRGAVTEERIVEILREANRRVYARANEDAAASGMGTTVTVALVEGDRVVFGHVGDSRAYLIRDGEVTQVTDDHSLVAELVRSGRLSPEEAEGHPQRSVITRALGTDPDVQVDTFSIDGRTGDLFLICSDGLSSMIDDATILEIAARYRDDLRQVAKALVAAANLGGGEDNITVVLFEIAESEPDERTREAVEAGEPEPAYEPDEEDTLSEADQVPVIREEEPPPEPAPQDTIIVRPDDGDRAWAPAAKPTPEEPTAGPLHKLLALLVIVGLIALIAFLVLWGLAR